LQQRFDEGWLTVQEVDFKDAWPNSDVTESIYQHPVSWPLEHAQELAGLGDRVPKAATVCFMLLFLHMWKAGMYLRQCTFLIDRVSGERTDSFYDSSNTELAVLIHSQLPNSPLA
jgi:hypothetical protein